MSGVNEQRLYTRVVHDVSELIFGDLDDVVAGLAALKMAHPEASSISIEQVWTGFEDCYFEAVVLRPETDDELASRVERERAHQEFLEKRKRKEMAEKTEKKMKEIERLEQNLAELKRQRDELCAGL